MSTLDQKVKEAAEQHILDNLDEIFENFELDTVADEIQDMIDDTLLKKVKPLVRAALEKMDLKEIVDRKVNELVKQL